MNLNVRPWKVDAYKFSSSLPAANLLFHCNFNKLQNNFLAHGESFFNKWWHEQVVHVWSVCVCPICLPVQYAHRTTERGQAPCCQYSYCHTGSCFTWKCNKVMIPTCSNRLLDCFPMKESLCVAVVNMTDCKTQSKGCAKIKDVHSNHYLG